MTFLTYTRSVMLKVIAQMISLTQMKAKELSLTDMIQLLSIHSTGRLLERISLWSTTKKVRFFQNLNFTNSAKNVRKIKEKESIFNQPQEPINEYLNEIDQKKEIPKSFGLLDYQAGNSLEINLKSFYLGNRYTEAFSKGIHNNKSIKNISLSRTMLNDKTFARIIENMPNNVETLDISNNDKLGNSSYERISLYLDDPYKS